MVRSGRQALPGATFRRCRRTGAGRPCLGVEELRCFTCERRQRPSCRPARIHTPVRRRSCRTDDRPGCPGDSRRPERSWSAPSSCRCGSGGPGSRRASAADPLLRTTTGRPQLAIVFGGDVELMDAPWQRRRLPAPVREGSAVGREIDAACTRRGPSRTARRVSGHSHRPGSNRCQPARESPDPVRLPKSSSEVVPGSQATQ